MHPLVLQTSLRFALGSVSLGVALTATAACGGSVAPSDEGQAKVVGDSYGLVYALVTNELTRDGKPGHVFGARLHDPAPVEAACDGATATRGSCCFVPPHAAPAAPAGGTGGTTGFAGQTADGSPAYTEPNLGELTLRDATTGGEIGRTDYGDVIAGFGTGRGYVSLLGDDEAWSAGDALVLDAAGAGDAPSFRAGVTAVDIPTAVVPTGIPSSSPLALTWTPDASATTMTILLDSYTESGESHGTVACVVDEKAGAVTIDAALLAELHPGDSCWGTFTAESRTPIQVGANQVAFAARGIRKFVVPVE